MFKRYDYTGIYSCYCCKTYHKVLIYTVCSIGRNEANSFHLAVRCYLRLLLSSLWTILRPIAVKLEINIHDYLKGAWINFGFFSLIINKQMKTKINLNKRAPHNVYATSRHGKNVIAPKQYVFILKCPQTDRIFQFRGEFVNLARLSTICAKSVTGHWKKYDYQKIALTPKSIYI